MKCECMRTLSCSFWMSHSLSSLTMKGITSPSSVPVLWANLDPWPTTSLTKKRPAISKTTLDSHKSSLNGRPAMVTAM
jgi:hypothetical protein